MHIVYMNVVCVHGKSIRATTNIFVKFAAVATIKHRVCSHFHPMPEILSAKKFLAVVMPSGNQSNSSGMITV